MINIKFEEARTLIDELHRENRITNNEYNILRDCIDEAENKIETLLPLRRCCKKCKTCFERNVLI